MFSPGHWAMAFINSLENLGGDPAEGINALETLASLARKLPGELFGRSAAGKLELFLREGFEITKKQSPSFNSTGRSLETALRFLVLLVKRNKLTHVDLVIGECKKFLDIKNGVVHVLAEYAFPPAETFEFRLKEAITKQTGASRVDIEGQVNKDLIGGYRLKIGDRIMDASVRSQLRELETSLASGNMDGGNQ